jgi:hypothetical protein
MLWSQFSAIFANFWRKNWRFSRKPMSWSNFVHNLALFWVKNANFFGENIQKIVTLVPGVGRRNFWTNSRSWALNASTGVTWSKGCTIMCWRWGTRASFFFYFALRGVIWCPWEKLIPQGRGPQGRSWPPGEKLAPRGEVGPKGRSWSQGEKLAPRGEVGPKGIRWSQGENLSPSGEDPIFF